MNKMWVSRYLARRRDTNTPTGNAKVNWLSKGQISKVKIGFFQLSVMIYIDGVNVQSKGYFFLECQAFLLLKNQGGAIIMWLQCPWEYPNLNWAPP